MNVLLLDPAGDESQRQFIRGALPAATVEAVSSVFQACERMRDGAFHVIAVFLPVPDWTTEELLDEMQRLNGLVPAVLFDPDGSTDGAIRATKLGAFHYFGAQRPVETVRRVLEAAIEQKRSRELALFGHSLVHEPWRKYLVGESQPICQLAQVIRLVGPRRCTVLISGETGTGKEMVARAIHMASLRAHLPLVAVNCHALPESLLEAELFGHVKGAFDEIGDMALDLQSKLLRVLQEREIQRIGSSDTVQVDVRVVAATNVQLPDRVRDGKFREDLYYRLNVVPITVPPLRERADDIGLLVHHFLDKIARQEDMPAKQITAETLERLRHCNWPGNVRQLENAVEMAVALSGDRMTLYPSDFPLQPPSARKRVSPSNESRMALPDDGLDFEYAVSSLERNLLEQALERTRGNKKLAAELLRLKRTTLTAKLKSLEVPAPGI